MDFCAKLAAMAVKYNIKLSDKQLEELTCYYEMLRDRDYIRNAEITVGTMIDCLSCYDAMMFPVGCRVIDVAAGPGFPGIPLKILRPDSKLCLLDASDYRLEFWREVVDQLKLSDVTLVHAPVEEVILMPEHREQYQVAVSRGLSFSLSKLVELCLQLVKPDGYYIQFEVERRKEVPDAAAKVAAGGGQLVKTVTQELEKRTFVYVKKG
ncbi:Ribosomal RNA small subunit methyltransferase G [Sporomusa ovata DSM 2662]|uniref:Ribosomal RNA small subunit methyltransferase G n=1 Tax=Sporomusa ovata TaxID=2378 RepID=A0A0U1KWK4_9FIRM|nr:RsmG family class I SAM-dependent methyltransferase [Sporomusa ovata]CQR71751.1 rRNA small subunit 7-methylguanosine (m7G) methyltransferase GidB [Sporomusa ovata]